MTADIISAPPKYCVGVRTTPSKMYAAIADMMGSADDAIPVSVANKYWRPETYRPKARIVPKTMTKPTRKPTFPRLLTFHGQEESLRETSPKGSVTSPPTVNTQQVIHHDPRVRT